MIENSPWWSEDGNHWPKWGVLWEKIHARFDRLPCLTIGDKTLTYGCVDKRARAIADKLEGELGWREFPFVALGLEGADYLAWAVGTWLAGGTILPFCKTTLERDAGFREQVLRFAGFLVEGPGGENFRRLKGSPANLLDLAERSTDGWHGIYFTSGSTGIPRAVVRGWKQAYFEAKSYASLLNLVEGDRCISLIRPFFGASTKHLLGCLLAGCHQSMGNPDDVPPQGRVLYATPSQMRSLPPRPKNHRGYEFVSLTGEAATGPSWPAINGWAGSKGRILNALGGTEFGVAAVELREAGGVLDSFAGRPIPGKTIRILAEDDSEHSTGALGLLHVSSPWLAEGYLDPMRDGSFHLSTFDTKKGVKTGDVAHLESTGLLRIAGRAGRMVKRGGKWFDTGPLSEFLSGHHAIREFAVENIGDSRDSTVWLVPQSGQKLDLARVRNDLLEALNDKALLPCRMVAVASIPLNRHGKAHPAALSDLRNRHLVLETLENSNRLESIARRVAEGIRIGKTAILEPFVPDGEPLDSLEWHELTTIVERLTGKRVSVADLLAFNSGAGKGIDGVGDTKIGLRVFPAGTTGNRKTKEAGEGVLWFGDGIGSVVNVATKSAPVWHWDCDRCMASPIEWGGPTIQSMARHFLDQATGLPTRLRVGGFSLGALVAYEVARLLVARGARVDACILVDPPELRREFRRGVVHFVKAFVLMNWDRVIRVLGRPPGEPFAYKIRRAARRLALLRYPGGIPVVPTHLFTSDRNSRSADRLIHGDGSLVRVVSLGVKRHIDSVRDAQAVALWSRHLEIHERREIARAA